MGLLQRCSLIINIHQFTSYRDTRNTVFTNTNATKTWNSSRGAPRIPIANITNVTRASGKLMEFKGLRTMDVLLCNAYISLNEVHLSEGVCHRLVQVHMGPWKGGTEHFKGDFSLS